MYNKVTGMADLTIRNTKLTTVINGLVCQTNLKKAGRLRSACSRSLNVKVSVFVFTCGRAIISSLYLITGNLPTLPSGR